MRGIKFDPEFDAAVQRLGGYRLVDEALEPIMEGLYRNPWGFPFIENDWIRVRYAKTIPTQTLPALLIVFRIEPNNDVTLLYAEEAELF